MASVAPADTGYGSRKNSRRLESLGMRYWVATGKRYGQTLRLPIREAGTQFTVSPARHSDRTGFAARLPSPSNNAGQIGPPQRYQRYESFAYRKRPLKP